LRWRSISRVCLSAGSCAWPFGRFAASVRRLRDQTCTSVVRKLAAGVLQTGRLQSRSRGYLGCGMTA
jgi:hypothetical protein